MLGLLWIYTISDGKKYHLPQAVSQRMEPSPHVQPCLTFLPIDVSPQKSHIFFNTPFCKSLAICKHLFLIICAMIKTLD